MKVQYEEIQVTLVTFVAQDIVTLSGFDGGDHNFPNPNEDNQDVAGNF